MSAIRKLSVGPGYPDRALHFQVGAKVSLKGNSFTIESIEEEIDKRSGILYYKVYIRDEHGAYLWKSFNEFMPLSYEDTIPLD